MSHLCDFAIFIGIQKFRFLLGILASSFSLLNFHFVMIGGFRVLQKLRYLRKNGSLIDWVLFSASNLTYSGSSALSFYAQVNISITKFIKFFKSVVFVRELRPFASASMLKFCSLSKIRKFCNFLICLQCWALHVYFIWCIQLTCQSSSSSLQHWSDLWELVYGTKTEKLM